MPNVKIEGDKIIFTGGVAHTILPDVAADKLPLGATPSVANISYFIASNPGAVTVTDFKNGSLYQTITILGDGNTTVANNVTIKTNTGAAKLLLASKVYRFTRFGNTWNEDA